MGQARASTSYFLSPISSYPLAPSLDNTEIMNSVPKPSDAVIVDGTNVNASLTQGDRLAGDVARVSLSQKGGSSAQAAKLDTKTQTCVLSSHPTYALISNPTEDAEKIHPNLPSLMHPRMTKSLLPGMSRAPYRRTANSKLLTTTS